MKIALLVTDNREPFREYNKTIPWFGTAPAALLQGFAKLPDLEVHVVSCTQRPMKSPEKLADNIYFHSLLVPKIGWMRTGYYGCIRAVRPKLKEIKPDLVHGQGTERDCALSAVFSGYPNVLTIHGNMRLIAKINRARPLGFYWLAAKLEALTLPRTDGIVCISDYTQEAVRALAKKTWVVPNAVDDSFFEIRSVPTSPSRIICVGNVDRRKNQNALISALDELAASKNFELIFLGQAYSQSAYAREFLEMVTARPWCRYKGFVDREGLKKQLATATGLILPSLEDNCPMVILEAMAAGVPVAAARVGGVPGLVRDRDTGLLFDPRDQSAMAAAVRELLETSGQTRAVRAKEEALARFHPETIALQHEAIYREVISETRER
jgi:glycosyltransferase involved in cell wall biosynthesis